MRESERVVHLQVDVAGERLDRYLARALPDLSRSQVQRLIRDGLVALGLDTRRAGGSRRRDA
jgi:23S rRNA pseudouridine1911/1915/1917 synthase